MESQAEQEIWRTWMSPDNEAHAKLLEAHAKLLAIVDSLPLMC